MKSKLPIRKKCSLLLELLIALLLVSICLSPLLKPHLSIQKEMIKRADERQLYRLTKLAAIEVKALLFENHFRWEELRSGLTATLENSVSTYSPKGKDKIYTVVFSLENLRHYKQVSTGKRYLLLKLSIFFERGVEKNGPFTSYLFLQEFPNKVVA